MRLTPIGLQIRPVMEEDYYDIYRLYRQLVGAGNYGCESDFARIFKMFFNSPEREAYVATVHNNVIGFVTLYYFEVFHYGGQVASIQELVVTEEFRGRGVGRALVEFVRRKTAERKCHGLEVATDLWQGGAKSFYEKCGLQGKSLMVAT
ncbi:MAG: N-acetyltransferase family protein [Bacillota bacterium]